jgi:microsomal epoxide hydrolase
MPPRPYRIEVPDSVLDDLKRRLKATRWPEVLPDARWDYGANLEYIQELCAYWADSYDWRRHEAALNAYPQFISEIDGVDFHFWHVKGKGPNPLPLLLVHGWPGSIYEFHHLIGPLTDPAAHGGNESDAFDVVIPALPGYGFSATPKVRGWGPARTAAAFDRLMVQELGYERYGTQGGDWGGIITAIMGTHHAEHIAGVHLNFVIGQPPGEPKDDEEREILAAREAWGREERAYSDLHGTKPVSLAIAQADSPAGIAAWITEKFRTWSDCGGDIETVYTKDQLLTNIMFYWAPNSIAGAANMYYEARKDWGRVLPLKVEVPVGVASFPKEIARAKREWLEPQMNVVHWTEMPRGGHFAALEEPDLLLEDVRTFFRLVR